MAIHVSNMKELNKALQPVMMGMVDKMAERVEQTLNYFLQEYYNSYDPVYYRRSYDFLHSAIKTEPKVVGNKVVASVYIDTDSMDNYYEATGKKLQLLQIKEHMAAQFGETIPLTFGMIQCVRR